MRTSDEPVFPFLSCLCRVSVAIALLLTNRYGRVEPDADDRSGRKRDVFAVGRRNRTACANHGAEDGALHAAENPADHAANTCADAGRPGFLTDAAALE